MNRYQISDINYQVLDIQISMVGSSEVMLGELFLYFVNCVRKLQINCERFVGGYG